MPAGASTVLFGALPKALRFSREEKRVLKDFARTLQNRVADGRAFTCLLTDEGELRRLNKDFLKRDYATDVLSFASDDSLNGLGDIAISVERSEAQALEFGHQRLDEICVLMLHGVLHLAGMDHEHDDGQMARAEHKWRTELGLPETLIGRAATSQAS